jgi:hypothetical protein
MRSEAKQLPLQYIDEHVGFWKTAVVVTSADCGNPFFCCITRQCPHTAWRALGVKQQQQRLPGLDVSTYAAICLLRGKAFEALDNRQRAIACYTSALQ